MSNELMLPEKLNAIELFKSDEAVQDILSKIEKEAKSIIPDISTEQGRKEIASLAYKVARTKTAIDNLGKDLTESARQQIEAVNKGRKEIRDRLDALKDEVRAPLTEFENKEKARKQEHEDRLQAMLNTNNFESWLETSSEYIEKKLNTLQELYETSDEGTPYNWEEFQRRADDTYKSTMSLLRSKYEAAIKSEEQAAELEKLRKEKEERERKEHEDRIAKEAADRAKREAEEKAEKERLVAEAKANAERELLIREKEEYERKAKEEKERIEREAKAEQDRIQREKEEAEQKVKDAEIARIAAEEKAKNDAIAALLKAAEDKQAAIKAERDRQEAEKKAEAEAIAKREADQKHRAKINNEALSDILVAISNAGDVPIEGVAKEVITAIAQGKVRHIKINY